MQKYGTLPQVILWHHKFASFLGIRQAPRAMSPMWGHLQSPDLFWSSRT